jgi:hypothetical protein
MPVQSHRATLPSFDFSRSGVGVDRTGVPLSERIAKIARRMWPAKTAPHLASRMDATVRAAEMVLTGERGLSGESFVALLRSDVGYEVLEEIMGSGDAKPSWWPEFERAIVISDLERQAADNSRKIQALVERTSR